MAKRKPCPACGLGFIKGRIVCRLIGTEAIRQRVCQSCAGQAVLVLASDAQARCQACGTNLARYCAGCVGKAWEGSHGATVVEMLAAAANKTGAKRKADR